MIPLTVATLMVGRVRNRPDFLWAMVFLAGTSVRGVSAGFIAWLAGFLGFGVPLALSFRWRSSNERRGVLSVLRRHTPALVNLSISEALLPGLAGALLGLIASLVSGTVPWQLWLVLPFVSVTASSLAILLDGVLHRGGHVLLALYWLWSFAGLSGEPGGFSLLLVPAYPALILAQKPGTPHSDGFLALSALLMAGVLYLGIRRNLRSTL